MESIYRNLLQSYKNGTFEKTLKDLGDFSTSSSLPPSDSGYIPYPEQSSQDFYKEMESKKEFTQGNEINEFTSFDAEAANRCNTSSFKLGPHQLFVKRFLSPQTPYNGLLLFHSVGVGKTCSAISIAEQYIGLYKKRVLVVLSSNLKDNFQKQIFDTTRYNIEKHVANLCTGVKYPEMVIDRKLLTKDVFEKRINKIINERYQFLGYKELVELMKKIKKRIEASERDTSKHETKYRDKIRDLFSDRLIIIDEAHNLRMPSETGKKQVSAAFLELLQCVENTKLLLMTATPMFNDPREIVWVMNLLLTNDKRENLKVADLFDKGGLLTKKGMSVLLSASQGYVSYMRGENPFSFPFRLYPKDIGDKNVITTFPSYDNKEKEIPKSKRIQNLQLIGSEMSPKQISAYLELMPKNLEVEEKPGDDFDLDGFEGEDEEASSGVQNMLQLSNIVYPTENVNRSFGSKGFTDTFIEHKNGKNYKIEYRGKDQFLSPTNIKQYSPKIKRIVDYVLKTKGIVFVYSQYYYSGIIPLALALEHVGYNKLGGNIGTGLNIEQKAPLIDGSRRPNYVILSRNKYLSPNNDKEIALSRSIENMEGEQIKVIIVSKIGTEGLDFKRIREIHLLDPWYNINRAEQIIGRGVRTCSHIDLPKAKRNTSIFMHALTMPDENDESIDLRVYRIAENKQYAIQKVENVLRSSAIDCNFNEANLYFPVKKVNMAFDIETSQGRIIPRFAVGDSPSSPFATHVKCVAPKHDAQTNAIPDTSTYHRDLVTDEIDIYKQYVISFFRTHHKAKYIDIHNALKETYMLIDEDILKYSLDEMIEDPMYFEGINNRRGSIVYAGNSYIFKSDAVATDFYHKARLPLDSLQDLQNKKKFKHSPSSTPSSSVKSKTHDSLSSPGNPTRPLHVILDLIKEEVEKVEKYTNKKYHKEILEGVIDRLTTDQITQLLVYLNANSNTHTNIHPNTKSSPKATHDYFEDVKKSIEDAKFTLRDAAGKVHTFHNHIDGEFYCLNSKGSKFTKCTALDLTKISKDVKTLRASFYSGHDDNVKGYVEHKKDVAKFKVRDGSMSGYVCFQTHSLQIEDLRQRILALDPDSFDIKAKLSKAKLCDVYEAILRRNKKVVRPFMRQQDIKGPNGPK